MLMRKELTAWCLIFITSISTILLNRRRRRRTSDGSFISPKQSDRPLFHHKRHSMEYTVDSSDKEIHLKSMFFSLDNWVHPMQMDRDNHWFHYITKSSEYNDSSLDNDIHVSNRRLMDFSVYIVRQYHVDNQ